MAESHPKPDQGALAAALIGSLPMLQSVSHSEKVQLLERLAGVLRSCPTSRWYPQTGPQSLAYISQADELFFGGSAGGGKSDLILGLSVTSHINSLILRLQSTQLTGFKERINTLSLGGDRFQGIGPHGGIFRTNDGRIVEFSGCESLSDANSKFRGRGHDLKAFDELPVFPQSVYQFIIGWNRTAIEGQRCRVVGAGNPPSRPEEEWVLDYWKPWLRDYTAEPGEIRWFIMDPSTNESKEVEDNRPIQVGKETLWPKSRTFIPARLEDNPILEKTGYRQVLINMPEPYRSQLLYGDMKIGLIDDAHQLIPTAWVDAAMKRWTNNPPRDATLTCVAVDAARGGKNRSVVAKRYGNWSAPLIAIPGKETPDGSLLANRVMLNVDNAWSIIIVDLTGTAGGGLFDSLKKINQLLPVYGFVAACKSEYKDKSGRIKMRNKRAEAYWRLRDMLDPIHGNDLMLPPNKDLRKELTAARWYMYASGAGLEEKEEIEKRLGGESPDLADAVAMTTMDVDATAGWVGGVPQKAAEPTFMGADLRDPELRHSTEYRDPWS